MTNPTPAKPVPLLTAEQESAFRHSYAADFPDADFAHTNWDVERTIFKRGWDAAIATGQAVVVPARDGKCAEEEATTLLREYLRMDKQQKIAWHEGALEELRNPDAPIQAPGAAEPLLSKEDLEKVMGSVTTVVDPSEQPPAAMPEEVAEALRFAELDARLNPRTIHAILAAEVRRLQLELGVQKALVATHVRMYEVDVKELQSENAAMREVLAEAQELTSNLDGLTPVDDQRIGALSRKLAPFSRSRA